MTTLTNQFATPDGFVNLTGIAEYSLPGAAYMSETFVSAHLYLGPSSFYSWWLVRGTPTA